MTESCECKGECECEGVYEEIYHSNYDVIDDYLVATLPKETNVYTIANVAKNNPMDGYFEPIPDEDKDNNTKKDSTSSTFIEGYIPPMPTLNTDKVREKQCKNEIHLKPNYTMKFKNTAVTVGNDYADTSCVTAVSPVMVSRGLSMKNDENGESLFDG